MTINIWTQPSGYSLGNIIERENITIDLPVNNIPNVTYSVIAGQLPPGLKIYNDSITGNPFIVATNTKFTFCIRAIYNTQISDRTFNITVTGSNPPEFVSQNTILDIGPSHQFFAIDDTYIEYIIEATELLPTLRKDLRFFISDGDLPPGLSLNESGIISGVVHGLNTDIEQSNYTFTIAVTDGFLTTFKQYSIYIVGPDYLTADNESMKNANHLFTADVTSLRPIQWVTPSNLGTYRSNNFITIQFETINNSNLLFTIDDINKLPPGMVFDSANAIIYGNVPYQSFNSKTYIFTITASVYNYYIGEYSSSSREFVLELIGNIDNTITWNNIIGKGAELVSELGHNNNVGLPKADQIRNIKIVNGGSGYTSTPSIVIVPTDGGAGALAYCTVVNGSIYSVNIVFPGYGYNTEPNILLSQSLGVLQASTPSTFYVSATSSVENSIITYTIKNGLLPPGLRLANDGEIIGIVDTSQLFNFKDIVNQEIQNTTFDNKTTTFDRNFIFTVSASNQYGYSTQPFSLLIDTSNNKDYSNIYVKPLLVKKQRELWDEFINNITIFPINKIYRIYDERFGLNKNLMMLIFSGIETSTIETYVNATLNSNNKKRFIFNNIKTAVAKDPTTNENIYEVIYIEMIDPREFNGHHLPSTFEYNNITYYSNSVTNWQIEMSKATDINGLRLSNNQNLLPLWMRTMTNTQIPGFVLALPICYCKVGSSSDILLNINNYIDNKENNFNFNNIDYTIDRYVIDSVYDSAGSQYIVFNNNRTII